MTDEELYETINSQNIQKTSSALIILIVSLVAFFGLGLVQWELTTIIALAVAIFVHEIGHLLAMKFYKYKNLKMLFIPFLGGVATGQSQEANAYKIAMISLYGPFIGLVSGIASIGLWIMTKHEILYEYTVITLFLNAFNLLPFLPLDGGHFLNETLFSRSPKAELSFKLFAILGLSVLAVVLEAYLLGVLAFFILITLVVSYNIAIETNKIRNDEVLKGDDLTLEKVSFLREAMRRANPNFEEESHIKHQPKIIQSVWQNVNKVYPTVKQTVFLLITYGFMLFFLAPFVLGGVMFMKHYISQL